MAEFDEFHDIKDCPKLLLKELKVIKVVHLLPSKLTITEFQFKNTNVE